MLRNQQQVSGRPSAPLLVVCYTNSALDQFLEMLLPATNKLVRLGSRSQSDKLGIHNLQTIRAHLSQNQLRKQTFYEQEKELLHAINILKQRLNSAGPNNGPSEDLAQLRDLTGELQKLRRYEDAAIVRKAEVVGVTVTGAAKHRALLELARPSVVVVEEAAEILEADLVAALPSSCTLLVMIGRAVKEILRYFHNIRRWSLLLVESAN